MNEYPVHSVIRAAGKGYMDGLHDGEKTVCGLSKFDFLQEKSSWMPNHGDNLYPITCRKCLSILNMDQISLLEDA
jgi:hypothetical protein